MNMKFEKGNYVSYKNQGICQILDMETQTLGQEEYLYYKLKPIAETTSTYYVPADKADVMLREILTKEEIMKLIDAMASDKGEEVWLDNRRERRERYAQILKGDDQKAIIHLLSTLFLRKRSVEKDGKRLSSMDDAVMKNAEKLVFQEFGFVLHMDEDSLRQFIDQRIQEKSMQ